MKVQMPKNLPGILGPNVHSLEDWERFRRDEIIELFAENVYGKIPKLPVNISYDTKRDENEDLVHYTVTITAETKFGKASFDCDISIPKHNLPAPCFLLIRFPYTNTDAIKDMVLPRGYALASFDYTHVSAEHNNDFSMGLPSVIKEPDGVRKANTWGGVAAWAYAAILLMDKLVELPEIDSEKVMIMGHSRTAKAALWAGANDRRFAMVFSNEAGCGGNAITREKVGEHIAQIVHGFPSWFCKNYENFGDKEDTMPFDQHMLLALIAPRPLAVSSAVEDIWSGPEHEFLAALAAGEAYSLYGKKGLQLEDYPPVDTIDQRGFVAYHLRPGKHELAPYDIAAYLDYADEMLGQKS